MGDISEIWGVGHYCEGPLVYSRQSPRMQDVPGICRIAPHKKYYPIFHTFECLHLQGKSLIFLIVFRYEVGRGKCIMVWYAPVRSLSFSCPSHTEWLLMFSQKQTFIRNEYMYQTISLFSSIILHKHLHIETQIILSIIVKVVHT